MKILLINIICFLCLKAEAQTSALKLADSLYQLGNYQKAIELYQNSSSTSAVTYQKIAQAYQATGNIGLAIKNYEKAIQLDQKLIIAKSNLGKLYYQTSKFQLADSLFKELTYQFPENPDFYYRLALAKDQLNDSTAVLNFQKVLQIDKNHQQALYAIAKHKYSDKEYEEVEKIGEQALSSYPENTKMISLLGKNAIAQKNILLAKSRFEQLLKLNKKTVFTHFNLGTCYFILKEYKKAYQQFVEVIQLEKNNQQALLYAGKSLNELKRYSEAEEFLKLAVLLADQPVDDYYTNYAISLQNQKKFKLAIDNFKIALEEYSQNYRAQYELAICVDNYYKDLQTKINYYELFLRKFENEKKAKYYVYLAKNRLSDLHVSNHLTKN
ncbi:Anaphase-promoting complex, cyclosome, subunit 3 [Mesonia phycicola]|uniref:Anaphase-promoting complex, cyclosome, subunit 3 n=1 Tax=Mesonia phycicola TaxID=579105 RepID=A0A1M6B130_9FLAO|nr:tetratricopeptide repeat protein [Mesonia phycicola]SHI42435.1 Anaphase-promoting complex, cyclosome, subunit 3 [Mesonia phycicola]